MRRNNALSRSMEEELKGIKNLILNDEKQPESSVMQLIREVESETQTKVDAGIVNLARNSPPRYGVDPAQLQRSTSSIFAAKLESKSKKEVPETVPLSEFTEEKVKAAQALKASQEGLQKSESATKLKPLKGSDKKLESSASSSSLNGSPRSKSNKEKDKKGDEKKEKKGDKKEEKKDKEEKGKKEDKSKDKKDKKEGKEKDKEKEKGMDGEKKEKDGKNEKDKEEKKEKGEKGKKEEKGKDKEKGKKEEKSDAKEAKVPIPDLQSIKVFVCTWNMQGKLPPEAPITDFIPIGKYDVYAIGAQECEKSITASIMAPPKHEKWEQKLKATFGDEHILVRSHTLGCIHLAVYIKKSLLPFVSEPQSADVPCGIANVLNNKGGIGVSFSLGVTRFLFLNCHLTAHDHNVLIRNADVKRIESGMNLIPVRKKSEAPVVHDRFDYCFWFGDMNYRIIGKRTVIEEMVEQGSLEVLVANDQLTKQKKDGEIFNGFSESPLVFKPSYKFDDGSDTYDTSAKARVPSWTDRILFKGNQIVASNYKSWQQVRHSDHRPVSCDFQLSFDKGTNENPHAGDPESKVCSIL